MREDLNNTIRPSKKPGTLIAPNFFLTVSSGKEPLAEIESESSLNGAYGARSMHALQNYGKGEGEEPDYDGKAYAYSATLYGGFLELHSHHLTPPAEPGEQPGCHTTLLASYALHDKDYMLGITANQNLKIRAKEDRGLDTLLVTERIHGP